MNEKRILNAREINKIRYIFGIVNCSLIIILTVVVVSLNLIDFYQYDTPESGVGNLRMFTTLSNIIAAFSSSMCLPFQIDGLRRNRYKLPRWIVLLMYVGAVGAFLTFFVALSIIAPFQGFSKTMFEKSNLFLHTINPILITFSFVFIISDSHIRFTHSFIPLLPIAIYMIVYFFMVFVFQEWRDHYKVDAFIPWPISLILLICVSFGICELLRFLHNLRSKIVNKRIETYYLQSPDFDFPRVSNAISHLAELEGKFYHEDDDIYIPVDIIKLLSDRYSASKVPLDILYDIYLEQYLITIGKKTLPSE